MSNYESLHVTSIFQKIYHYFSGYSHKLKHKKKLGKKQKLLNLNWNDLNIGVDNNQRENSLSRPQASK
jgi:hypothetical protein